MDALLDGFAVALTPVHLWWALAGATLGTAVGVLPGIGPALTVALLLPVTYNLSPTAALIMFAGIYYGAMYGGSTTSILLNTPGESATVVTALEGHQMARRGRGAAALMTAAIGSFVAGTLATIGLSVAAPALVGMALAFGPAEYFALMLLAFVLICRSVGPSRVKGLTSLCIGLTLGFIGIDGLSGEARLTFGIPYLLDGIDIVIVAVGLFAVGEALIGLGGGDSNCEVLPIGSRVTMTREDWARSWKPWLRGTLIGFPLGALPAGGSELPTLLSYAVERRSSRRPEDFGRGAIEGVAGPEAANNAAAAGTLVPLLTLGLPTSATAAVLLAAFQQFGLQPGPLLFEREPELVWGVIASLYVGNLMLLLLNLPLVRLWVKLLMIPRPQLFGGILVIATLAAYTVHRSIGDLVVLTLIGVLGYVLRRMDMPVAPVMIGLILGPIADQQLRRALAISGGDPTVFVTRPIALGLLALALIAMLWRSVPRGVRVGSTAAALAACSMAGVWASEQAPARTPDIHYTPTRHAIVDAMLQLATVGPDDVVYDLGSGDGRIPIIAAQKYGARGVGIEIDSNLVAFARLNAREAGVADRVTFIEGDLFTADISAATVITLYLSPNVNRRLETKLRSELRPGTRIVSHQFPIGSWTPEQKIRPDFSDVFLWRIPHR